MDEKLTHISQIAVGDIIYNNYGHYVKILTKPKYGFTAHWQSSSKWTSEVTHTDGEYEGNYTDNYLLSSHENGMVDDLHFHYRNPNGERTKVSTIRDSKVKHYFV